MAGSTRDLPVTPVPDRAPLPPALAGRAVAVQLDVTAATVSGGHHEGLLQVRQPWKFGLSEEQTRLLHDGTPQLVAVSLAAELRRQGISARLVGPGEAPRAGELLLQGRLEAVELHTYGSGAGGVGSAGDYWEARLRLRDLALRGPDGRPLWTGDLESYAKRAPCPVKLDWTMLDVAIKSVSASFALARVAAGQVGALEDAVDAFAATYTVERPDVTPVEVAARRATLDLLGRLGQAR